MKRKLHRSARVRVPWLAAVTTLWLAVGAAAYAQTPLSNLVFTIGTTLPATNGQSWSYLAIGSQEPALIAGKHFGVFGKNGAATNPGSFTLRGKYMIPQTSAAGITSLLNQAANLHDDLNSLDQALALVLRNIPGTSGLTLAQKLATALPLANTDPALRSSLALVGRYHPAVLLCNGLAFSESITSVTTYEIRELDPVSGNPAQVIGRVTVLPGSPVILPAPGVPFQLNAAGMTFPDNTNNAAERIRIYLRWGTPPELRRLALLNYGYNVWRMPRATAEANQFNLTPPTLTQLYANATQANDAPVVASKDFPAAAPDDATDTTTFFFSDDNGRKYGLPAFTDGAQYYYFVTARDPLGRDGLVSPGALATACRRQPPAPPTALKVKNTLQAVTVEGVGTNQPRLWLSWTQNTDTNQNVTEYWIYRWENPTDAMSASAAPLDHRVGVVPQLPGTNVNQFADNGQNLPTLPSVSNYWFTVRAVSQAACGPLFSAHSAPAWGVLREREGPAAATGEVLGSCGAPAVMFQTANTLNNAGSTNNLSWAYRLTCQRRDQAIAWVQFTLTSSTWTDTLAPVQFPPDGDTVSVDVLVPAGADVAVPVVCTVGDYNDQVSAPVTYNFTAPVPTNTQLEAVFYAGELLLTALSSADPLLPALNGSGTVCSPAGTVTPYPDGTVGLTFSLGASAGLPCLVQVLSNSVWADVGVAWPDTNLVYWVNYPACLIGPVPTFRGCAINVPNQGDCAHHLTRAGTDGALAPIIVSFHPTFRSQEYRLYRRADDGPPSLVAQGAVNFDPAHPERSVVIPDDTMPPSAARLCYYVQLLDQHGNGSPLSLLGCPYTKPATLPRPVLSEPIPSGDASHPQVVLNWFCPTSGVQRFQFKIHRDDPPAAGQPTGFRGSLLRFHSAFDPRRIYSGLLNHRFRRIQFEEAQLTPPVGPSFGPGPQFSLTADVVAGAHYTITVTAMDAQGKVYTDSEGQAFVWQSTNVPTQSVPWPARPLPPVTYFDDPDRTNAYYGHRVAAVVLRDPNYGLDTRYPVGIRIGDVGGLVNGWLFSLSVGTTNFFQATLGTRGAPASADPNRLVYRRDSAHADRSGDSLLPIAVYRQQVANAAFPKVTGSVIQVTPLIEQLPWNMQMTTYGPYFTIPDLLFASGREYHADSYFYNLYLRDQQPALVGAAYHYYLVRFNTQHEVAETIDAGTVTIPPN